MDVTKMLLLFSLLDLLNYSRTERIKEGVLKVKLADDKENEVKEYLTIRPKLQHGRDKNLIKHSLEKNGLHVKDLIVTFEYQNKEVILDLRLNSNLIPEGHFLRYQALNGEEIVKYLTKEEINFCHYHGGVRGYTNSRVVLSTCNALNGIITYNGQTFEIIPGPTKNLDSDHFLYRHAGLLVNSTYGNINEKTRAKRAVELNEQIFGPYNSNQNSSYIELVVVVDNSFYKSKQNNLTAVHLYVTELVNNVNSIYGALNIYIALMGIVVWSMEDKINISRDSSQILKNFVEYRKTNLLVDHPNDNAQLLTNVRFDAGVIGRAYLNRICTMERSGGITFNHRESISRVAEIMAHELGHNLGMEHDTDGCICPGGNCLMESVDSENQPKLFSDCSKNYLRISFGNGMNHCLKDKPAKLFGANSCGNSFVEPGEQCDCGLPIDCRNKCCDPMTCKLHVNATCATGECCNLTTCELRISGFECRKNGSECDLPEYCSGNSEYCPKDVFKHDSASCINGEAFCYKGVCQSHTDQCKLLWGSTGQSLDQYYFYNEKGSAVGNCGYNKLTRQYKPCTEENIYCGAMQCHSSINDELQYGNDREAIIQGSYVEVNGILIYLKTVNVDLGIDSDDIGLTPNGAKCGHNKMCLHQECLSFEQLRRNGIGLCPEDCNGNGTCDSEGHCRCFLGFEPPSCTKPVIVIKDPISCPEDCNGNGTCDSEGSCRCFSGFEPPSCTKPVIVIKDPKSCPEDCNGNGKCDSEGHCRCFLGFEPPSCTKPVIVIKDPISCPEDCNGNGTCDSEGSCRCFSGFEPPSCTKPVIVIKDPKSCPEDCNGNGECDSEGYCRCFLGFEPPSCKKSVIVIKDPISCPEDCNGNGTCDSEGHCRCFSGFEPPSCTKPVIVIKDPISCPEDCNGNGTCDSEGHCRCFSGFEPPSCTKPVIIIKDPGFKPNESYKVAFLVICAVVAVVIILIIISISYYWRKNRLLPGELFANTYANSHQLQRYGVNCVYNPNSLSTSRELIWSDDYL